MATNPRLPAEPRDNRQNRGPELVPPPKRPGSGLPGVLFAIVVAAALIAAIVYYMPRAPKKSPPPTAAQVPVQPNGSQLQFTGLHVVPAPTGGAATLQGQVMNTGNRPVIGVVAQLSFRDNNGKILSSVQAPLDGMIVKGTNLEPDAFANDPLRPNASRPFRITVEQVPAGWNHQLPGMRVVTVSAEGGK
jgi:hypothetical protein